MLSSDASYLLLLGFFLAACVVVVGLGAIGGEPKAPYAPPPDPPSEDEH